MTDHIECSAIAKRFQYEWVFKELSCRLLSDQVYGILGPNGSGKSTFLKIISGFSTPTKGSVNYLIGNKKYKQAEVAPFMSFTAPYIDLIEEMMVSELIAFHQVMRPFPDVDLLRAEVRSFPFKGIMSKRIYELSSGMKQRIKLVTAILSGSPILLLDEPGSNLDVPANQWWQELLSRHKAGRIVVIASNDPQDLQQVTRQLDINAFKKPA